MTVQYDFEARCPACGHIHLASETCDWCYGLTDEEISDALDRESDAAVDRGLEIEQCQLLSKS
jgi:hypothetical protein